MDHLPLRRAEKRRDRVDAGVFFGGGDFLRESV